MTDLLQWRPDLDCSHACTHPLWNPSEKAARKGESAGLSAPDWPNFHQGLALRPELWALVGVARARPDGLRAWGATCPRQDSLLACKAGAVSEVGSLSR